jgi:subtilisin family serine protease
MRRLLLYSLALCSLTLSAQSPAIKSSTDPTDIYADSDAPDTFSAFSLGLPSQPLDSITALPTHPQPSLESIVPGRLVVFYRGGIVPSTASALAIHAGARAVSHMPTLGLSSLQVEGDTAPVIASLLAQPEVTAVLHDRYVTAKRLITQQAALATPSTPLPQSPHLPSSIAHPFLLPETDTFYESPQGWSTIVSGGYGNAIPGGPATGPWNTSMGAGVRIAILDSGVDTTHPDIAANLILNLSEVQQSVLPSICDDGSPTDQSGHGTFTASLAAGAQGFGTGLIVGVAPQASLLNIKVVERLPATGSNSGSTATAQCEAGTATGLLSWVLQGIQDAISNHADIINASLGTLIDSTTGDGAGWIAQMNSVTYAAAQAGVVIVAAAGNDGLDLSSSKYVDLPGQARNVLAVVASTNPACAENLYSGGVCATGPVTRAYYSNYGASLNAIAAPGGSLPAGSLYGVSGFVRGACSTGLPNTTDGPPGTPGQSLGCFSYGHVPYVQAIGTSAAAPLVAGAAAILKAAHPTWTPTQIISVLQSTATHTGSMTEPALNLPAALALQTTP